MNEKMTKLFVQWARSKGIQRPTTADGMKALVAQFNRELQQRAVQQVIGAYAREIAEGRSGADAIGAAGDATYASDPVQQMEGPPTMLREQSGLVEVTEAETEDSDWTELVRNRQAAMEEADGNDLAANVIYRDKVQASLSSAAPFVNTNPPTVLQSQLGQLVSVAIGQPPQQAASWTGDDASTLPVTVMVAPAFGQTTPTGTADKFRPFANFVFGTHGSVLTAEVDLTAGTQATLPCSAMAVLIGLENTGTTHPVGIQYFGQISFWPMVKHSYCTRTRYIDGIGASGLAFVRNIPLFAQNVTVWRDPITEAVEVLFFDSQGNQIYEYILAANQTQAQPVPLSGDFASLTISDTGGGGVNFCRVIFGLSF